MYARGAEERRDVGSFNHVSTHEAGRPMKKAPVVGLSLLSVVVVTPPVSPAGPKTTGGRTEAPGDGEYGAPRRSIRSPATRWSAAHHELVFNGLVASTRSRHRPGWRSAGRRARTVAAHLLPAHGRGVARYARGRRGGEAVHGPTTSCSPTGYDASQDDHPLRCATVHRERREASDHAVQFTLKRPILTRWPSSASR